MTKQEAINKLISIASQEVGYHEGENNYNKFAEDSRLSQLYGWNVQNQPYCDIFVDWCFINAFGYDLGSALTYQYNGCSGAACAYSANYYQVKGAYWQYPEVGDQIFFYYGGAINHTGIVEKIENGCVYTIEGNSSDKVMRRVYSLGDSSIAGYGRPNWKLIDATSDQPSVISNNSTYETAKIQPGDEVKIIGSSYYNGVKIPDWVKNKNWIVMSVFNDRVVINEAADHSTFIMSPINIKDIEKVNTTSTITTYTVQNGDNLWKISQKLLGSGLEYRKIKELNKLKSDLVYPGQVLKIPNKGD